MARLYDQIMSQGFGIHERASGQMRLIGQALERAIVVDISNVGEYFRSQNDGGHDWSWSRGDFPNVAPPWPTFFMELRCESGVKDGILFHYIDANKLTVFSDDGESIEDAHWVVSAWPFIRLQGHDSHRRFVPCMIRFVVGGGGERIQAFGNGAFGIESYEYDLENKYEQQLCKWMAFNYEKWLVYPSFLALSFLHCKNVTVVDELIPEKLAKAYQKRHKRPMVQYKTLEITPMKKILRTEGKSETLGLRRALHICRGHFATYSEERPLFGRVSGRFFIPMHRRGSLAHGAIIKDYSVKEPLVRC